MTTEEFCNAILRDEEANRLVVECFLDISKHSGWLRYTEGGGGLHANIVAETICSVRDRLCEMGFPEIEEYT